MPRLRMIAGPNGSGKTTLTNVIREKLGQKFGLYTNADEFEVELRKKGEIDFAQLNLKVSEDALKRFAAGHALADRSGVAYSLKNNRLVLREALPDATYFPALLSDFIRSALLDTRTSFVFETVMSEPGKIDLLRRAQQMGYRTYLYFVCVEDPGINAQRVSNRVEKGGHFVPDDKIRQRYERSLSYLLDAVKASSRAYLFDNSGTGHRFVSEITDGRDVRFDIGFVPAWFTKSVLNRIS